MKSSQDCKTKLIPPSALLHLLLGLLLSALVSLSSVSLLALSGWLICAAAVAGLQHATAIVFNYLIPASGIRFFAMLRIGSRYGERVVTHNFTFQLLANLRVWFYRRLEPLVPAYFIRYRAGDLLSRSISDIDTLDQIYLRLLNPMLVAIILAIAVFVFLHFFSWKLAYIVLFTMLLVIVLVSFISGLLGKTISKRMLLVNREYRYQILSFLAAMKDILLSSSRKIKIQQIESLQNKFLNCQQRMSRLQGFCIALTILISGLLIWVTLYFGIPLVAEHKITGPELGMITLTVLAIFEVISPLPMAFAHISGTMLAVNRLSEIASEKPTVQFELNNNISLKHFDVQFEHVDYGYTSEYPIITDLNWRIPFRSKFVLTGMSGVGKSTILQLVARFFDPEAGVIRIGGIDIKEIPEQKLRKTISFVAQQDHFFNKSIRDNLLLANPNVTDEVILAALTKVKLDGVIADLKNGLDTQMGEFGQCFSAGQLRRFSIVRAMLRNSPIVLLDEPTEGLDKANADQIWKLIKEVFLNKTVIVVTHQPIVGPPMAELNAAYNNKIKVYNLS